MIGMAKSKPASWANPKSPDYIPPGEGRIQKFAADPNGMKVLLGAYGRAGNMAANDDGGYIDAAKWDGSPITLGGGKGGRGEMTIQRANQLEGALKNLYPGADPSQLAMAAYKYGNSYRDAEGHLEQMHYGMNVNDIIRGVTSQMPGGTPQYLNDYLKSTDQQMTAAGAANVRAAHNADDASSGLGPLGGLIGIGAGMLLGPAGMGIMSGLGAAATGGAIGGGLASGSLEGALKGGLLGGLGAGVTNWATTGNFLGGTAASQMGAYSSQLQDLVNSGAITVEQAQQAMQGLTGAIAAQGGYGLMGSTLGLPNSQIATTLGKAGVSTLGGKNPLEALTGAGMNLAGAAGSNYLGNLTQGGKMGFFDSLFGGGTTDGTIPWDASTGLGSISDYLSQAVQNGELTQEEAGTAMAQAMANAQVGGGAGGSSFSLGGLGNLVSGDVLGGGLKLLGGYLAGNAATGAAKTQADAQLQAAQIAANAAKFRPVGVSTNFGTSGFGYDANGNLISAGYTLNPALQAQQNKIMGASGGMLDQFAGSQAATAPMSQAAQTMMGLGNKYLSTDPQQQAQKWMANQQALLSAGNASQLADINARLAAQGRSGLSIGGSGTQTASNPELQAYYNALQQQNLGLAAQADQAGQQYAQFGAGMVGSGGDMLKGMYGTQSASLSPYLTGLGAASTLEGLGQNAMDIGTSIGAKSSTAAANAGQYLAQGMTNAAGTMAQANAFSPWATALTNVGGMMQNYSANQQQQAQQAQQQQLQQQQNQMLISALAGRSL